MVYVFKNHSPFVDQNSLMKKIRGLALMGILKYSAFPWTTLVAAVFVFVSLTLSIFLLFQHLSAYKNPEEQKFLFGIVLMVPSYAVESFVSLLNPSISLEIEILRDCYEAFAMYCFGRYLIACLGGEKRAINFMEREGRAGQRSPLLDQTYEKGTIHHIFPMNLFLEPWKLGQRVYQIMKAGIVQYMIIKAVTSVLAVFLEAFDVYCEGDFKWGCGYPYMAVVINFSQTWALYCLVQFYEITKHELSHINPLSKFLTFKSIVFLTWWQGVAIALLFSFGLVRSPIAQELQFKSSIQNFFICIEMGIASMVHLYVFPSEPYKLMGDYFTGDFSVLGDYSSDCPLDPDEVRDSERRTKLRLPRPADDVKIKTAIRESVRDVFVGGGGYIVSDLRFTVNQARVPVEKGITKFNAKLHKKFENIKKGDKDPGTRDDSCLTKQRVIRGIDDPLLNGSYSDSGDSKKKRHRRSYTSGGEIITDQSLKFGRYEVRGSRWVTKD
ncbi:putative organic solute transporter subunit alpha/Transmembrane protein [Helianthus annuus]|nr:putative organic solute transporter subunit alpha/Transmembrane protein [Helianthus annuus]